MIKDDLKIKLASFLYYVYAYEHRHSIIPISVLSDVEPTMVNHVRPEQLTGEVCMWKLYHNKYPYIVYLHYKPFSLFGIR